MNMIIKKDKDMLEQNNHSYRINKDFDTWKPLSKKITLSKKIKAFIQKDKKSLSKKSTTIDTNTIDTLTIDKGLFGKFRLNEVETEKLQIEMNHFNDMRKKIRKPMTDRAYDLLLEKLYQLSSGKFDVAIKILQQSIESSWQGIFPLKEEVMEEIKRNRPEIDTRTAIQKADDEAMAKLTQEEKDAKEHESNIKIAAILAEGVKKINECQTN